MRRFALMALVPVAICSAQEATRMPPEGIAPVVEAEELVYVYEPADNGAGPMWCFGCTCLARLGERVFASGLETLPDAKPLNNVRWLLFARGDDGWSLQQADEGRRTREPCPLACFPGGPLFMSTNPAITEDPEASRGPARPEILRLDPANAGGEYETILPEWDGQPPFTEHSYPDYSEPPQGALSAG